MRGIPGRKGLEQTAQPQFKVGDRVEFKYNNNWYKGKITDIGNLHVWIDDGCGSFWYRACCEIKLLPAEQIVNVDELIHILIEKSNANFEFTKSSLRAILTPYMEGSDE